MWRGNPGGCHYRNLHFYISENLHEITNKELTPMVGGWLCQPFFRQQFLNKRGLEVSNFVAFPIMKLTLSKPNNVIDTFVVSTDSKARVKCLLSWHLLCFWNKILLKTNWLLTKSPSSRRWITETLKQMRTDERPGPERKLREKRQRVPTLSKFQHKVGKLAATFTAINANK